MGQEEIGKSRSDSSRQSRINQLTIPMTLLFFAYSDGVGHQLHRQKKPDTADAVWDIT